MSMQTLSARRTPAPVCCPDLSHRLVTQADSVWIVREADTSFAPGAPADSCLICESALTIRRTWAYPLDWSRLPDSEILGLFS
jgi:hypothetical protein